MIGSRQNHSLEKKKSVKLKTLQVPRSDTASANQAAAGQRHWPGERASCSASPAVRRGDAGTAKGEPAPPEWRRRIDSGDETYRARPARPFTHGRWFTVSHQPPDLHWIIVEGPEYKASIFNKILIG
ncbi:hypothetical protein EVAR_88869_1 [Eumeta japonica]|uniref:Uncharacterized protein n=1 Tax=Eumeta variegata TaxID=151549 RepID=A0A4C1XZX1_EUMVA|nr:hypothetical protein EVAR_88869_1 [Eumeta japonica]